MSFEPPRCWFPPTQFSGSAVGFYWFQRAPHRSLLKAVGVRDGDMHKPFIGIVNSYVDIIPGHVHLQRLGRFIKDAVREAGGVPFEFNTIGVDDGIAMGHDGMHYSLPSRELIADSVETMVAAHCLSMASSASPIVTRLCPACGWGRCAAMCRSSSFLAGQCARV